MPKATNARYLLGSTGKKTARTESNTKCILWELDLSLLKKILGLACDIKEMISVEFTPQH